MKTKTIGKIQLILGILFMVLVLTGGYIVIRYEIFGSFVRAVVGVTDHWGTIRSELNINNTVSETGSIIIGQISGYGLMARIGWGLAFLIAINGMALSCLLITEGLAKINRKE